MADALILDTAVFSGCLSAGTYAGEVEKELFLNLQNDSGLPHTRSGR